VAEATSCRKFQECLLTDVGKSELTNKKEETRKI